MFMYVHEKTSTVIKRISLLWYMFILSVSSLERKSVVLIGTNTVCNHFTVSAHTTQL